MLYLIVLPNENDIRLVVNNVVQEPGSGKAYTATGTALTLSAALTNGTDEMYCVFLGRATATSAPGAGSIGTAQLASDSVTLAKMASGTDGNIISYDASGNPVAVATGNDGQVLTSAGAGAPPVFETPASAVNTPAFSATINSQTLSASTATLLQFDTMLLTEPSSTYNTSTYKFTPGVAGTYLVSATIAGTSGSSHAFAVWIKKNASTNYYIWEPTNFAGYTLSGSRAITLDDNDYIQLYANVGMSNKNIGSINTQWSAFRIIE